MRIVHLVGHRGLNGVATSVKMLVDAQLRAGHEVMVVHPRKSWIEKQSFAGPITLFETSYSLKPGELLRTGYAIRDWGRTLVHAHGSGGNKYLMAFRMAVGVPAVMTAHARHYQIPWMFAHAVVGLSRQTMDYYISRRLVAARRIFNVPNIFNIDDFSPVDPSSRTAARAELGIRDEAFLIGAVGSIGARKRQADMARVLARLVEAGVDAELLLVGGSTSEPDAQRDLAEAMADPRLAGRVHMPGHRADAVRLIPALDLYLCASAVEEAPIAPLEAMALAVPVVSTDVGNMADLLPPSRILPVGDIDGMTETVIGLARNPAVRAEQGAFDRATVATKLSARAILPKIEEIYRFAIASARDRSRGRIDQALASH
ncbi:glycosyltransferase family 4 protein [Pseudaminobacter sp. 19-2017]|uniref:Glycosyltransferase family 4 protein n=1 Tax=Pseudaminobacter soli (ex Zhang et al. 2022) TaxID=2831468 RepID=A0A942I450_9HYPH|nr:glycosyltransferase family 4 protein [Pseudaminobacter soli]MBS3650914.1 glycosyltransferase family 4 protein [Pseudaminobacter soli]